MPNLLPLLQQNDDANLEAHVEHHAAQRPQGLEELSERIEFAEESRETILSYARVGWKTLGAQAHTRTRWKPLPV
jgi:hypothetical protein